MESWKTSLLLLAGSLTLTVLLWMLGFPFFFLFLIIPVLPVFRKTIRRCPVCGWETTGHERFCPFDATPLEIPGGKTKESKD